MQIVKAAALAALLGGSVATSSAIAGPFVYNGYDVVNDQGVNISGPGNFNINAGSGQIILHGSGADVGTDIAAWCIDIFHWLQSSGAYAFGSTPSNNGTSPPSPATAALSPLIIGQIGALIDYGNAHINTFDVSSGTQIAIWTTEYAGQGYIINGSAGANAAAASLLALLPSLTPDSSWLTLTSNGQGLVTNQGLATGDVPEPMTLALLAAGLVGLGAVRRRGTVKQA